MNTGNVAVCLSKLLDHADLFKVDLSYYVGFVCLPLIVLCIPFTLFSSAKSLLILRLLTF